MSNACQAHRAGNASRPYDLPTIKVALSDPVIRTMMAADHVDPRELEHQLRSMARKLASEGRAPS